MLESTNRDRGTENDEQGKTIYGTDGNDILDVAGDGNYLSGGEGNDELYAAPGNNNELYGDAGDDYLYVEGANNYMSGGDGADILKVASGNGNQVYGDEGDDELSVISGDNYLYGGDGDDHLYGCFLQAFFGESCKIFLENIASPFWQKLQRPVQSLREPLPATADIG